MNAASNFTAVRTASSTTQSGVTAIRTGQPKPSSVSIRQTVRRLMNALMQSLATPHI
jgi:hypothetical protein